MFKKYQTCSETSFINNLLDVSGRARNLLSVQYTYEILCDNNHLSNQLLLSSEIGPFEDDPTEILQNSMKSIENRYGSTIDFTRKTYEF